MDKDRGRTQLRCEEGEDRKGRGGDMNRKKIVEVEKEERKKMAKRRTRCWTGVSEKWNEREDTSGREEGTNRCDKS